MLSFSGGEGERLGGFRATVPTADGNIAKLIVWAETPDLARQALKYHRKNSNPLGIVKSKPDFTPIPYTEAQHARRDILSNATVWLEGYVNVEPVQQQDVPASTSPTVT